MCEFDSSLLGSYLGYDRRRFTTDAQSLQGHRAGSSERYWSIVSSIISDFCGPNVIGTVEASCRSGWS